MHHVAHVPGRGQPVRADTLGGGEVAGLDQHLGQPHAACPGYQGRDVARDLAGLPGQSHGVAQVADGRGIQGEVQQGHYLPERMADLAGHGQGPAGVLGGLGEPAQIPQRVRPAGQGVGQRRGRRPTRHRVAQDGEMLHRPGDIGRELCGPAEEELRGAPLVTAYFGAPGDLG